MNAVAMREPALAAAALTVLLVDDDDTGRMLARALLRRMGHDVIDARNGREALALARCARPDLILSDVLMPEMDGFEFCRQLKRDPVLRGVPFAFVTGTYVEPDDQAFAQDVGAARVLLKPVDSASLAALVEGVMLDSVEEGAAPHPLDDREFRRRHATTVQSKLRAKIEELEQTNARLRESENRAQRMLDAVVSTISKIVEYRDPYTTGHERRVGELAVAIGRHLGWDNDRLTGLLIGGCLHDVGKVALPSEILTKPGRLSPIELTLLQAHAQIGYDILCAIDFPWQVAEMARQHHERLDGSGYPRGLAGEQILYEARVLAVADVVEAMMSHRPYRPAIGLDRALCEVEAGRGRLYDPTVVDACLHVFRRGEFGFAAQHA